MADEVKYLEYREYLAKRQAANTAIQALLAGSKLSAHLLSLTHGSTRTLGEIFPNVSGVRDFNLRSSVASQVLDDAEHHLGVMAVPYVLAVHEDFAKDCLELIFDAGLITRAAIDLANSATVHSVFEAHTGAALSSASVEIFDLLRLMRNAHIHRGGRASADLAAKSLSISPSAATAWTAINRQAPPLCVQHSPVKVGFAETLAALAVTKQLAREMNAALASCCPR